MNTRETEEKGSTVNDGQHEEFESFYLEPMRPEDISEVSRVEHRCFTNPWPESAYRRELRNPANNYYVVMRQRTRHESAVTSDPEPRGRLSLLPLVRRVERTPTDPIVGFAGMWIMYDEAHVTTIGIAPELRGRGLGEVLVVHLFEEAIRRNSQWVTLEVRISNSPAITLYEKYGFTIQGVRRRYYSDNGEDAHIMWSPSLKDDHYLERFDTLRNQLQSRLATRQVSVTIRGA